MMLSGSTETAADCTLLEVNNEVIAAAAAISTEGSLSSILPVGRPIGGFQIVILRTKENQAAESAGSTVQVIDLYIALKQTIS